MFVDSLLRGLVRGSVRMVYHLTTPGLAHVPEKGAALLVANHLSLADGFLVAAAVKRPIRFLIWRPYYEARPWHWFLKRMQAIPVSEKDSPKEILRSLTEARRALENGELVCLFAEGAISRTGNLLAFKRGFEVMIKGLDVPVIPVNLDRIWGSIFSFEHGRVLFKKPRRIPYPVTVSFGQPMRESIDAEHVRQAVMDLGTEAFRLRLENSGPLIVEFLKRAKQQPGALAVADSLGKELSFSRLAAAARVFADTLRPQMGEGPIGLLVPSSAGGAIANLAVALLGRVAVNLNYTAGTSVIDLCIQKAGIRTILASRRLLEKLNLPAPAGTIFLEDVAPTVSKLAVIREQLLFRLLPRHSAIARLAREVRHTALEETATIVFSSGSTGIPKGVVLTHSNILSNILAISQVFDLGPKDRMLGVLPFFHSFGYTVTLWFPLLKGFTVLYHPNPLDAKIVGDLSQKYDATVMLATPTFLNAYTRKCRPEQFKHLRYVITGAERMRESIAKAWQEKFGMPALEGYGCTELSPVATVNIPNISMGEINQTGNKPGKIGQPIPGVSVKIVDPDTFEPKAQGESGMLLVKGPNVMKEYLGEPKKTAEVLRDGWYVTGDLAKIDEDGFVQILDRLSRFSKVGGEMVPHMNIEEKLNQLVNATDPIFAVTSVPDEKRGESLVVLYAKNEASIDEVYRRLQASDLPKLWIPDRSLFFEVETLPYLGTGKLDLARLRQIAKEKTQKS